MKITIIKSNLWIIFLLSTALPLFGYELPGDILVNQVGYPPKSSKVCMIAGEKPIQFRVIDTQNNKTVFKGIMEPRQGRFGNFLVGVFSELHTEGIYVIEAGKKKSEAFRIAGNIYEDAIEKSVTYFSIQRCGPSTTGYAAPCHVDDGRRLDTGPGWPMKYHRNVSGGWHDAGDYRKWVAFTLYGMIGLCKVAGAMGPDWHRDRILDELRWGNRYFLNMQNVGGYVMNYCGGDDGMYLTDNIPGTADDRPIHTEPASFVHDQIDRSTQYNYIWAEALTAGIFKSSDPEYSDTCLNAALKCYKWCYENFYANKINELGSALMASIELFRVSGQKKFLENAIVVAGRIVDLQVKDPIDEKYGMKGFFITSSRDEEPAKQSWQGPQCIMGLCDLYEMIPDHKNAVQWKETIRMYYEDYLTKLTSLNNFELVPIGLFKSNDPGGEQRIGDYWYRYLSVTADNAFAGGTNANISSAGIGFLYASKILQNDRLSAVAQRQLDWIIGLNPLNISTIEEVGRNQPIRFINTTLNIPPLIPGAVMNGIGGTMEDVPDLVPGSWQNCEYWTPEVAYTMWLMAKLQKELR